MFLFYYKTRNLLHSFVNFDSIATECRNLVIRYEAKFYSKRMLIRSRVPRFGPSVNNEDFEQDLKSNLLDFV